MALRKRIVGPSGTPESSEADDWLPLDRIAEIDVTSEDPEYPLEGALLPGETRGWRAGAPGEARIQIRFDEARTLSLIHLVFEETGAERVQEFSLRWSGDHGRTFHPVVRQQFTFSPGGATRETEHYRVDLRGVTDLELHIIPDISGRPQPASLRALRVR